MDNLFEPLRTDVDLNEEKTTFRELQISQIYQNKDNIEPIL